MVAIGLIALFLGAMAGGAYLFERLTSSDPPASQTANREPDARSSDQTQSDTSPPPNASPTSPSEPAAVESRTTQPAAVESRTTQPAETPADEWRSQGVDGPWTLETTIASSSLAAYQGLRLEYRIDLQQDGNRVRGSGRKERENDKRLGGVARTPIAVEGTLEGDRLTLTFTERGARRESAGTLTLTRQDVGLMRGRFSSDAARSAGTAVAWR